MGNSWSWSLKLLWVVFFYVFDVLSVKVESAIQHARRSSPVEGNEAMAVVSLLQYADTLQLSLKAALKEDADWYRRFMPLTEVVSTKKLSTDNTILLNAYKAFFFSFFFPFNFLYR